MSSKKRVIYTSPITNQIFCAVPMSGKNSSVVRAETRQEITIECLMAVCEHALNFGKPVVVTKKDGTPEFELTVKKLGE